MTTTTAHKIFKVFLALCALNGAGGLLVVLLFIGLRLLKLITGVDLLPLRPGGHVTIGGVFVVLAMSLFWLFEVAAFWAYLRRFSSLAIYLAVSLLAFWIVCITDILVFEVLGSGAPFNLAHLALDLLTLAVICWPCIALARWLSRGSRVITEAEPGVAPNGGPATPTGTLGAVEGPPSVS